MTFIETDEVEAYFGKGEFDAHFKIVFDLPTPRPHFILLRRFRQLSENEQLTFFNNETNVKNLIQLCSDFSRNSICETMMDHDIIFSLHTGSFMSSDEFHVHLCVETNSYLEMFTHFCPSKFIYRQKRNFSKIDYSGQSKIDYVINVRRNELNNLERYERYKDSYLQNIQRNKPMYDYTAVEINFNEFEGSRIFFHDSEPKIGFKGKDNRSEIDEFCHVLQSMKNFALQRGYFDHSNVSNLCLYINNKSKTSFDVTGYILVKPDDFYQLNPRRDEWIENYKKVKCTIYSYT